MCVFFIPGLRCMCLSGLLQSLGVVSAYLQDPSVFAAYYF